MENATVKCLISVVLLGLCLPLLAQQNVPSMEEWRAPLHTKKLADMTKEELVAYKAAVEAKARELGIFSQTRHQSTITPEKRAAMTKMPKRIPGTSIAYDTGVVTGTGGIASQMIGNRFDSALNPAGTLCCFPVEATGTITMVTFNMVNTFFNSAVFSIYSDVMGATAMQVTSMAIGGIATGVVTHTLGTATMGAYQNGAFLAGIWQFDPTMTGLGVGTSTTGGQGFHAISLNDGAVGTNLMTLTSLNAVFRVQGNVATPVELMNFEVE